MPWARMHALKDYLDMVEMLSAYPGLHQTFNLVPSLVEQLEDYASGDFSDVYWDLTLKPAADLDPEERAFVVEHMCERPDHPRAGLHPRYLELARSREARASSGRQACAAAFTTDELRDLQVWFNLAWFDPQTLAADPLRELVERGRGFREEDKLVLAGVQADILTRTLPAYREAARRGQAELSTSPYYHPILPLLCNSDSARISAPDVLLPRRRFAHREDAVEQITTAIRKHESVFGERPRGMWCSEQAVGEEVIPLLTEAGLAWTISDESVLARSLGGVAVRPKSGAARASAGSSISAPVFGSPYSPYRLARETGEIAIVFRDHTLSDLIGFAYQSWDSREAAADLLRRLRELRNALLTGQSVPTVAGTTIAAGAPLVTIALDGENAWEYYPHDGRDFLGYLYEGLSSDPSLRCVTISEHLRESPPTLALDWLHTGSWIGGDLLTWSGDRAHCAAWDLLNDARDVAVRRNAPLRGAHVALPSDPPVSGSQNDEAWHHILVAEGSDWFWWFGDHHHTELDPVWDLNFRLHLQEVYRSLEEPIPTDLLMPILSPTMAPGSALPQGALAPVIDGLATDPAEWGLAGFLAPDLPSTMQRSSVTKIKEVRFGWCGNSLCLLVAPGPSALSEGLEMELRVTRQGAEDDPVVQMTLEEGGSVALGCVRCARLAGATEAAWREVVEVSLPLDLSTPPGAAPTGLVLRIGRDGMTEHVFHSAGLVSIEGGGQ
jgi:alpha-amylase/alpha-mannosidase (GH57 family)